MARAVELVWEVAFNRGWRTFLALLAGSAVTWVGIEWTTDFRTGAVTLGLQTVAALIGGIAAFGMAFKFQADTPLLKALMTFVQGFFGGFGSLALNELTEAAVINFGAQVWRLAVATFASAIVTLVTNASDDTAKNAVSKRSRKRG